MDQRNVNGFPPLVATIARQIRERRDQISVDGPAKGLRRGDAAKVAHLKASTLGAKYLLSQDRLRIFGARAGRGFAYAFQLEDGGPPAYLWSVLEGEDERKALEMMAAGVEAIVEPVSRGQFS